MRQALLATTLACALTTPALAEPAAQPSQERPPPFSKAAVLALVLLGQGGSNLYVHVAERRREGGATLDFYARPRLIDGLCEVGRASAASERVAPSAPADAYPAPMADKQGRFRVTAISGETLYFLPVESKTDPCPVTLAPDQGVAAASPALAADAFDALRHAIARARAGAVLPMSTPAGCRECLDQAHAAVALAALDPRKLRFIGYAALRDSDGVERSVYQLIVNDPARPIGRWILTFRDPEGADPKRETIMMEWRAALLD